MCKEDPNPREDQLERLLAQVRRGDPQAFGPIVLMFERSIRGWISVRCPPGCDIDDVAQRTFVEAYRRIDEYRAGTNFGQWLFTIAKYQVMTECTRLRREVDYHSRYSQHALVEELQRRGEAERTTESPRLAHLESCLQQLRQVTQELLKWRYRDEMPLADIATRTERSVGAIKKHLYKARRQLHDCIERKIAT